MTRTRRVLAPSLLLLVACGRIRYAPLELDPDGGDARDDGARPDARVDGGTLDATTDGAGDGADNDADGGNDAIDGVVDDGGPGPGDVAPHFPWNGYATGRAPWRLRWAPVAGATTYYVQIDDSCALDSFRSCAFESPEIEAATAETSYEPIGLPVAPLPPVGTRYFWRVRACDDAGCSAYGEPRYVDVGRDRHDFNGDGYADVVISATGQDAPEFDEGNVMIFYGGATGIAPAPSLTLDNPGDQAGTGFNFGFGYALGTGDVDGDGYADLIATAPVQTPHGQVFIFHGGRDGLGATPDETIDCPIALDGAFGYSATAMGDLDGDGYADVVAAAYSIANPEAGEGTAWVFRGTASGVETTSSVTLDNPADQANGLFGHSVAAGGDLDGDGYVDLVIGAIGQATPENAEGAAYVYYGGRSGVIDSAFALDNPLDVEGGRFGTAVTNDGDLTGDGYADLVIGANAQSDPEASEGAAYLYEGGPSGIATTPDVSFDNPGDTIGGAFGIAASIGRDVNGDGVDDLFVGAYSENRAFLFAGSTSGVSTTPIATLANPLAVDGAYGVTLAIAGDVNGDALSDLVVGAKWQPDPTDKEGRAYVYFGGASIGAPARTLVSPTGDTDGCFGWRVR